MININSEDFKNAEKEVLSGDQASEIQQRTKAIEQQSEFSFLNNNPVGGFEQQPGLLYKVFKTPVKSFVRGGLDITESALKGVYLYGRNIPNMLDSWSYNNDYKKQLRDLEIDSVSNNYSSIEYNERKAEIENNRKRHLEELNLAYTSEQADTKETLRQIGEQFQTFRNNLNVNSQVGEWKLYGDLFASLPTMGGVAGAVALAPTPLSAGLLLAVTSGLPVAGDIAARQIELQDSVGKSLKIGAVAGAGSALLQMAGARWIKNTFTDVADKIGTKNFLLEQITKVLSNPAVVEKRLKNLSPGVRNATEAALEQGIVSSAQAAVERNIPKTMGGKYEERDFSDELLDYGYQGLIGALSGGLLGTIGSAVRRRGAVAAGQRFADKAVELGMPTSEAARMGDDVSEAIMTHNEAVMSEISDKMKVLLSDKEKYFNFLRSSLPEKENDIINTKAGQLQQQLPIISDYPDRAKLAATIMYETAKINSSMSGRPLQTELNDISFDFVNDLSELKGDLSDYLAREKEGTVSGVVSKKLDDYKIYLLKDADANTIVHEATHQLFKSITSFMQRADLQNSSVKITPRMNTVIKALSEVAGDPNSKFEWTREQQDKTAELFAMTMQNGGTVSEGLLTPLVMTKNIIRSLYNGMKTAKELNPKNKAAFTTLFSKDEAVNPDVELTGKRVAELRQSVEDIKKGKDVAVRDIMDLNDFINFGYGATPDFGRYSLTDYISEHPEWSTLGDKEKRARLIQEEFTDAANREKYPTDSEYIKNAELASDEIYKKNARADSREAAFNAYKSAYQTIFDNNALNLAPVVQAIRKVQAEGLAVVNKDFLNETSKELKNLFDTVKKYDKKDVKEGKKSVSKIKKYIDSLIEPTKNAGEDVTDLMRLSDEASKMAEKGTPEELGRFIENTLQKLALISERLSDRYFKSKLWEQQERVTPPIANAAAITGRLSAVMMKNIDAAGNINYGAFTDDLLRTLAKAKVDKDIRLEIISKANTLMKNKKLDGESVMDISRQIIEGINQTYKKNMVPRIEKQFDRMITNLKNNPLHKNDFSIPEFIKTAVKEIKKAENPQDFLNSLDFSKVNEGYAEGEVSPMQAIISQYLALQANMDMSPEAYLNLYRDISKHNSLVRETIDFQKELKAVQFDSFGTKLYYKLTERKVGGKIVRAIDNFFAGAFGGVYSNLVALFGEDTAREFNILPSQRKAVMAFNSHTADVSAKITKLTRGAQNYTSYLIRLSEKPFINETEGIKGELKDFTRGELAEIWLNSLNEIGLREIKNRFGNSAEGIVSLLSGGNEGITRLDRGVMRILAEDLKTIYPSISDTYLSINNRFMGFQNNYWPMSKKYHAGKESGIREDMDDIFSVSPTSIKKPGFSKKRTGGGEIVFMNPFLRYERYLRKATNYVNLIPQLNKVSAYLRGNAKTAADIQDIISEKFGKDMLTAIQNDLQSAMEMDPLQRSSKTSAAMNELLSNAVCTKLMFKAWAAVKQVPALINYSAQMPSGTFARYLLEGISHPKETYKEMMSFASVMDRFKGDIPNVIFSGDGAMKYTSLAMFMPDKFLQLIGNKKISLASVELTKLKNTGMMPIRIGDSMAVVYGGYAYKRYLEDFITDNPDKFQGWNEANKRAWIEDRLIEATETTQQSALSSTMGGYQRERNVLVRAILAFTSANAQYTRKMREGLYEYYNSPRQSADRVKLFKTMIVYGVLNPLSYTVLSTPLLAKNVFTGTIGQNDNDEWKENIYNIMIRPYMENITSTGGTVGEGVILGVMDRVAALSGQKVYSDTGNITPFLLSDYTKAINELFAQDKELTERGEAFAKIAQIAAPIPLETFITQGKGAYQTLTGDEIEGIANILRIPQSQIKDLVSDYERGNI